MSKRLTSSQLAALAALAGVAVYALVRRKPAGNVTVGELVPVATVTAGGTEIPWGSTGYVATPASRADPTVDPNSLEAVLQKAVDDAAAEQAAADAEFERRRLQFSYNLDAGA